MSPDEPGRSIRWWVLASAIAVPLGVVVVLSFIRKQRAAPTRHIPPADSRARNA